MVERDDEPVRVAGGARVPEGTARRVRYSRDGETREFLLCRLGEEIYALDTLCPHEGGRLNEGPLEGGRYAVCPLHLYRFDPRTGACVGIDCPAARTLSCEVRGSDVWVWVGNGTRE